jgi:hypothetical protein
MVARERIDAEMQILIKVVDFLIILFRELQLIVPEISY